MNRARTVEDTHKEIRQLYLLKPVYDQIASGELELAAKKTKELSDKMREAGIAPILIEKLVIAKVKDDVLSLTFPGSKPADLSDEMARLSKLKKDLSRFGIPLHVAVLEYDNGLGYDWLAGNIIERHIKRRKDNCDELSVRELARLMEILEFDTKKLEEYCGKLSDPLEFMRVLEETVSSLVDLARKVEQTDPARAEALLCAAADAAHLFGVGDLDSALGFDDLGAHELLRDWLH